MNKKGIGKDTDMPQKTCTDVKCPFHGNTGIRGRVLTGTVTSDKMTRTVTVSWTRRIYVPKYERYEKRMSSVKAHNPDCIGAKKGDAVRLVETKPLSKTKHFMVVGILGAQTKEQILKEELLRESLKESADRETDKATADAEDKKRKKVKNNESV
jgi:small subunit ribosomal protein S17